MPATMMHILAGHLLRPEGSDAFFLGCILPDCVDGDRVRKDHIHFRDAAPEEREARLIDFGRTLDLTRDYDLGVFFHLYLDLLWDRGPQRVHRQGYRGDNWFRDYRAELSRAGSRAFQRSPWAESLWRRLKAAGPEAWRSSFVLPEELILSFLDFNFHWHTEERLPEGAAFPDKLVDDFCSEAAKSFPLFLEKHFPGVSARGAGAYADDKSKQRGDSMKKQTILVLSGGDSSEREISLSSGSAVSAALREAGFTVLSLDPAREDPAACIRDKRPDAVFIALHGKGGEDGTIQKKLDALGVPYTGPGAEASAVCMDKIRTKQILIEKGVPTAPFLVFDDQAQRDPRTAFDKAAEALGLPLVMKAACQGSSIGTAIVRRAEDGPAALLPLFSYGDAVFAESFLSGAELTVPILGNDEPRALPVIEIVASGDFYDYRSKYTPGQSKHIIPARITPEQQEAVERVALEAYRATGCRGHARVDLMLNGEGSPVVVELNTSPGMTATSLFPDSARYAGMDFPTLVTKIIECALTK